MLSGAFNLDNISQTLRDVSQRKRQGVLEIVLPERKLEVFFVQGRIVELLSAEKSLMSETLEWLSLAGLKAKAAISEDPAATAAVVAAKLAEAGYGLPDPRLRLLFRQRVLEHFYALSKLTGGYYSFHVRMVEYDREFAPSISVGQLLLDLVDLESEHEKFEAAFSAGRSVAAGAGETLPLSEEEREIIEQVSLAGRIKPVELQKRVFLSRFHFEQAMLSLLEQGGIEFPEDEETAEEVADLFSALSQVGRTSGGDESSESEVRTGNQTSASEIPLSPSVDQDFLAEESLEPSPNSLRNLNLRLMESSRLSLLVQLVFLICAILGPVLLWSR